MEISDIITMHDSLISGENIHKDIQTQNMTGYTTTLSDLPTIICKRNVK